MKHNPQCYKSPGNLYFIFRFYERADLEKASALTGEQIKFMAKCEVFELNCKSKVSSNQITGKCYVWELEDYDKEAKVALEVYYTRAHYDVILVIVIINTRKHLIHQQILGHRHVYA